MKTVAIKAPFYKRVAAYIIDALVAFIPALAMYLIFTGTYNGWTPIWYESPVIAGVTMYDLPIEVHERVNTFENADGSTYQEYNVSFPATICRVMSVVVILFYIGYSTFCAYIFDGKTVGKKLLGLRMITEEEDQKKKNKNIFFREVIGKILLNSIPLIPILSIFTILFTKDGRAIHDMIGKTKVVEELCVQE